jgi:hypothetical protein
MNAQPLALGGLGNIAGSAVLSHPNKRPLPAGNNGRYPPIRIKIASTRAEREGAFRLVYQRYLAAGLCPPNPHEIRVTPYHLLPATTLFVAVYQGEVIFTLSLVGDGELGVPMESGFPDEVRKLRAAGVRFGELSCLADRRQELIRFLPLLVQATRLLYQYALAQDPDYNLLIAVHPKHGRFYERYFGFRPLAAERPYESVLNKPAAAYSLEPGWLAADRHEEYFHKRLPAQVLAPRPWPEEDLAYFGPLARPLGADELISGGYQFAGGDAEKSQAVIDTVLDQPRIP